MLQNPHSDFTVDYNISDPIFTKLKSTWMGSQEIRLLYVTNNPVAFFVLQNCGEFQQKDGHFVTIQ